LAALNAIVPPIAETPAQHIKVNTRAGQSKYATKIAVSELAIDTRPLRTITEIVPILKPGRGL
jgi:hypothetical protein